MSEQPQCKELLGFLSDYVDGTLAESLCREIEAHVAECNNCRIVMDTLRKTISLYQTTAGESSEVPPLVRERLFRTLNLDDYLQH